MGKSIIDFMNNGPLICAEGYLFELERRGYLKAGSFVPEVALDNPEVLEAVHRDFVKSGSDVIEAFTYNAHREKMRIIGKEELIGPLNRAALKIAKRVKAEFDDKPFVAGNISNTNLYHPDDEEAQTAVREMFREMIEWSVDEGVDYIIGETFYYAGEAKIALEEIKKTGQEAVITLGVMAGGTMEEGSSVVDTCRMLEDAGADVVGLNCFRGPGTMFGFIEEIRKTVSCHVAALPVTYRTTQEEPTFFKLTDKECTVCSPFGRPFPVALDPHYCNRYELADFAKRVYNAGVHYIGLCCGANPAFIREITEAVGKTAINSVYSPEMEKHFLYGNDPTLKTHIRELGKNA